MNSEDMFNVLFMKSPLLRMQFMETMRTAMVAENMKLLDSFLNERGFPLQSLQSNERIFGQDILTVGKRWETSKPESITGIGLLSMVLDNLASAGLLNVVSVDITSNDSGSDIQGITLSFQSSTGRKSSDTRNAPILDTLIQNYQNTRTQQDKALSVTDLPPIPGR